MNSYQLDLLNGNCANIDKIAKEYPKMCKQFIDSNIINEFKIRLLNEYSDSFKPSIFMCKYDVAIWKEKLSEPVFEVYKNMLFFHFIMEESESVMNGKKLEEIDFGEYKNVTEKPWYDPEYIFKTCPISVNDFKLMHICGVEWKDYLKHQLTITSRLHSSSFNTWYMFSEYLKCDKNDPTVIDDILEYINADLMKYLCSLNIINDVQFAKFSLSHILDTARAFNVLTQQKNVSIANIWIKLNEIHPIRENEITIALSKCTDKLDGSFWSAFSQICICCKKITYANVRQFIQKNCNIHMNYIYADEFEKVVDDKSDYNADMLILLCDNYQYVKYTQKSLSKKNNLDRERAIEKFIKVCDIGLSYIIKAFVVMMHVDKQPLIPIGVIDDCFRNAFVNRRLSTINALHKYANAHLDNHWIACYCVEHNLRDYLGALPDYKFKMGQECIIEISADTTRNYLKSKKYVQFAKLSKMIIGEIDSPDKDQCFVCMSDETPESKCIIKLQCNHSMCVSCYNKWYIDEQHSRVCTICKASFTNENTTYLHDSSCVATPNYVLDRRIKDKPVSTTNSDSDFEEEDEDDW